MQKLWTLVLATALVSGAGSTWANDALLKKHNCVACHAIDKKMVGPAYKDVAKKYAGKADALAALTKKVKTGGSGVWGAIPMPPHPQIAESDIQELVKYILTLK